MAENILVRLGTAPTAREGDLKCLNNGTCPDVFTIPQNLAEELGLAALTLLRPDDNGAETAGNVPD